jgi:hypothetical protein
MVSQKEKFNRTGARSCETHILERIDKGDIEEIRENRADQNTEPFILLS